MFLVRLVDVKLHCFYSLNIYQYTFDRYLSTQFFSTTLVAKTERNKRRTKEVRETKRGIGRTLNCGHTMHSIFLIADVIEILSLKKTFCQSTLITVQTHSTLTSMQQVELRAR